MSRVHTYTNTHIYTHMHAHVHAIYGKGVNEVPKVYSLNTEQLVRML